MSDPRVRSAVDTRIAWARAWANPDADPYGLLLGAIKDDADGVIVPDELTQALLESVIFAPGAAIRGARWLGRGGKALFSEANIVIRGERAEDILGLNNLRPFARNFKTWDNYDAATRTASSVKTLDLSASSYARKGAVASRLRGYVRDAYSFDKYKAGGLRLATDMIDIKQLHIVYNPAAATSAQYAEMLDVGGRYAGERGVQVFLWPVN